MDFKRYSRNLSLPQFDEQTQERISNSSVAIIGAGALGSVVAMYLAGSGIGRIGIADFDTIDISNLQRQVFYSENNCGKSKVEVISDLIHNLNSEVIVKGINCFITAKNASELLEEYDVIVECSDNPSTKELIVEMGRKLDKPVVLGGVNQYIGQVMVFKSDSPEYYDIFPAPESHPTLPCGINGVFGPVPGIVGSMQASEVIKFLAGLPGILYNTLLTFDVRTMNFTKFRF